MLQKIASVIICCFLLVRVSAQTAADINHQLNGITKSIDASVKDDNLSVACRDNLKKFRKGFLQHELSIADKNSIDTLIAFTNEFLLSLGVKGKHNCDEKKIKRLSATGSELQAALKKITFPALAVTNDLNEKKDSSANHPDESDSIKKRKLVSGSLPESLTDTTADNSSQIPTGASQSEPSPVWDNRLSFGIIFIVSLILLVSILYFKKSRDYKIISKKMEELKNDNSAGEVSPEETDKVVTAPAIESQTDAGNKTEVADKELKVGDNITEGEESPVASQPVDTAMATLLVEPGTPILKTDSQEASYFICEIMMTAGPRKKYMSEENADKDLGEDVCGFISNSNEVLIWLLDGTSDLHCLRDPLTRREYFSSRLLALGIAEKLKRGFTAKPVKPMAEMISQAIKDVKDAWLEVINILPNDEQLLLKTNIANKNFPECAATILVARLSINGDFIAYRSGDSKMLLFTNTSENQLKFVDTTLDRKNDESNDRVFFRLRVNDQEQFDIISNDPLNEVVSEKNINTIITFSDGIGMSTEQLLMEEYKSAPDKTRNELIYRSQETGDDKSICFIEIKEPGNL